MTVPAPVPDPTPSPVSRALPTAEETCAELLARVRALADPRNVEGMARFGISPANTLGVSVTTLRGIARETLRGRASAEGRATADRAAWRHELAACLWASGVHEARMLATIVDDPALVTREQALAWAHDSDSWDITDGLCLNLLDSTPFAYELPAQLAASDHEFARRAAFALIAGLAWHDKTAPDKRFVPFFALVRTYATDPRNFVRKAVSWALRHIGKRSATLHPLALALAEELAERGPGRTLGGPRRGARAHEREGAGGWECGGGWGCEGRAACRPPGERGNGSCGVTAPPAATRVGIP